MSCVQAATPNTLLEENHVAGNLEATRERRETVTVLWNNC